MTRPDVIFKFKDGKKPEPIPHGQLFITPEEPAYEGMVEVTPNAVRIRKIILSELERKKALRVK